MRRNKIALLCLGLLVSSITHSTAQQTEEITCTGEVLSAQGEPIAEAKVAAFEMVSDGIAGNIILRQVGEMVTKGDGAFVFTTEPRTARGTFLDGYVIATKQGLALGWSIWNMRKNATVEINLGEPKKLEGVIVNEAGKPIVGAEVRANLYRTLETAEGEEKRKWLPGIAPLRELGTKTDSRGRFFFDNLPADAGVDLLVTATGKATTYTYQSAKNESAFKAGQTNIRVVLPAEARIEGKILDPDTGEGIAGTKFAVVATSSGLFYYRFVYTTNDDGTFKVGGLHSDKYLLRNGGFPHTFVEVESGKTTNITVLADRLSRPCGIAGVVRDPEGKRLANAVVSTCPRVTEELITDARGEFSLRSKRARGQGEDIIYLLVRHKERNLAASIELDESAKEFDITVAPGTILSGKVVDVEGKPIPSAELSLTFRMSSVGYVMHDIIEIDDAGKYKIIAVPPGHTYSVEANAEGYGRRIVQTYTGGAENERIELEPLVLSIANLSASGIVVDEFDQPISEVRILMSGDGQPSRRTLTDAKGQFTIENICSGQINIYADKGTPRQLSGSTKAEAGETDIRIVVAEIDEQGRRVPRQPPSRVGKPLPELTSLKIELPPADIEGKMILVCFWDMNQRPSRNCIRQLSTRAQELKAKDIVVVAVQASKVDENTLNEWVKKNNIPFPAGMVQGDIEKVRFKWGVKSLPWLILTDINHLVRAEGFSMHELDTKLQQISGD